MCSMDAADSKHEKKPSSPHWPETMPNKIFKEVAIAICKCTDYYYLGLVITEYIQYMGYASEVRANLRYRYVPTKWKIVN